MIEQKDCWLKNNCNRCDCDSFCMRFYKLNKLYDLALMSLNQRTPRALFIDKDGGDLEAFKLLKSIENNIEKFVNDGNNVYIHSVICGNGKTSWALKLVQSYLNKIWIRSAIECKALFISVPKLLLALKDNISEKSEYITHIKENILTADLVIWDDVGTKSITNFESENLFSFIDSRISNKKANIFTSNLTDEELHKFLGDRLASRICNNSTNITLVGMDKRGI